MKIPHFTNEKQWTKGAYARDAQGKDMTHNPACSWCLAGWLAKNLQTEREEYLAREAILKITLTYNIPYFNDDPKTTFEMVQSVIEKANKILEEG